jgi:Xaa-Pro aminopeptidase
MNSPTEQISAAEYRGRVAKLAKSLKVLDDDAAIVIASADSQFKSHDQHFPFHQDRDFLYFTGAQALEGAALVVTGANTKPKLIIRKRSAKEKVWDGPGFSAGSLARKLGLDLEEKDDLHAGILSELTGVKTVYLNPGRSEICARIANRLLSAPLYELQAQKLPSTLSQSQLLTAPLRAIKSEAEIQMIRNAVSLTESALIEVLRIVRPGCSELQLARLFTGLVHEAGGALAFQPIVATGPNAAVLHHSPTERRIAKGDAVLFDVGAELHGYNGDISRTVLVGENAKLQRVIAAVDRAQEQIAKSLKIGAKLSSVKEQSVEIVARQLKTSGLPSSGSAASLVKSGKIKSVFPHSFGHSLGLDVHDPFPADATLAERMVFTVEPGLYLNKRTGGFSPFGVRIEDDFFITRKGPMIFSSIPQLIEL